MGITVGDIYTKFPQFPPEAMKELAGSNFDGRTVIPLSKLASYDGQYAMDLSIFIAQKEGVDYTNLLSGTKKEETAKLAGVNDNSQNSVALNKPQAIPMDTSVFDIQRPEFG